MREACGTWPPSLGFVGGDCEMGSDVICEVVGDHGTQNSNSAGSLNVATWHTEFSLEAVHTFAGPGLAISFVSNENQQKHRIFLWIADHGVFRTATNVKTGHQVGRVRKGENNLPARYGMLW
eukprot:1443279-Pyramimonas_sp.AAC.1